ncbi:hypothetical protein [Mesoterricola sediminis]|uniref:Uncharacterized protein n=1 Tax=Mesoterricola sediminis TaxID=2927980 RepID=A0AA48HEI7_9BACT|nr:hypothetical protein [Mesoterricola sediminis]BDU76788.1 hypothetical protein METESE_17460 [Mesoterricola sediminis]
MNSLALLAIVFLTLGSVWFAVKVFQEEDLIWALALLLVPFPVVGLYIWYRSGWDSHYRAPALVYLAGYLLAAVAGKLA